MGLGVGNPSKNYRRGEIGRGKWHCEAKPYDQVGFASGPSVQPNSPANMNLTDGRERDECIQAPPTPPTCYPSHRDFFPSDFSLQENICIPLHVLKLPSR